MMDVKAGEGATYTFHFGAGLGKGSYAISLSLSREDSHIDKNYEWRDNALLFHVFNHGKENFVGCNWLDARLEVVRDEREPCRA